MINFNKSVVFFSPNIIDDICLAFTVSLNIQMAEDIETYLVSPMLGGKNKKILFSLIKDKIWIQMYSWLYNVFSQAGKYSSHADILYVLF